MLIQDDLDRPECPEATLRYPSFLGSKGDWKGVGYSTQQTIDAFMQDWAARRPDTLGIKYAIDCNTNSLEFKP